jgi:hypothetical protein
MEGIHRLWADYCGKSKDTSLWLLEESGNVRLYKLQSLYLAGHNRYGVQSTYHVWAGDTRLCATECYQDVLAVYRGQIGASDDDD